jgi:hypothetical protein
MMSMRTAAGQFLLSRICFIVLKLDISLMDGIYMFLQVISPVESIFAGGLWAVLVPP